MKLLITGDWHLKGKPSVNRLGDFLTDQKEKVKFILEQNCDAILQPGDLGHVPVWPEWLKAEYIELFDPTCPNPILVVPGQHDIKHHNLNTIPKTTLAVMEAAEVICILGSKKGPYEMADGIDIYGAGFGEETPIPKNKNAINILLTHTMIVRDKPLWPGQTSYMTARNFMNEYPEKEYDLIVSGDNHNFFYRKESNRWLINCGALMRMTTAQDSIDHKPMIAIYETTTKQVEFIPIPIKPVKEVLNLEKVKEKVERNEKLEAFVQGLTSEYSIELDFMANLHQFVKENEVDKGTKDILNEVFS